MKLEKREEEKAKKEAGQGENIPDNLIISDYLGTPVEAYDEEGKKSGYLWECKNGGSIR